MTHLSDTSRAVLSLMLQGKPLHVHDDGTASCQGVELLPSEVVSLEAGGYAAPFNPHLRVGVWIVSPRAREEMTGRK